MAELAKRSDDQLRAALKKLIQDERASLAEILKHLAELNERRSTAACGFQSLFHYCVSELRLSEGAAYRRITAARVAKKFPQIYGLVESGALSLESIVILSPHLSEENVSAVLDKAAGKTTRQAEALIAELAPRPDKPDLARAASTKIEPSLGLLSRPTPAPADQAPPPSLPTPVPSKPVHVEPLSPGRIHTGATIESRVWNKIERIKGLLRHKYPSGRLDDVLDEMAEAFLDARDPIRRAERRRTKRPDLCRPLPDLAPVGRPTLSRALRDEVLRRDGGRCTFVAGDATRCPAKTGLEVDHVVPRARGGGNTLSNLRTLCRTHNQLVARDAFGPALVGRHRRR